MAASPDRRPSRDRDPQSGQARRDARPAGDLRRRRRIGGRARPARAGGNRHDASAPTRGSRPKPRRRRRTCRPSPTIPGLAVDALDGEPGIHSARWAGPDKDFRFAMNKIQSLLIERGAKTAGAPARRISSRRCASPGPTAMSRSSRRTVDGTVVWPPRGTLGFGYDPLFLPDGQTRTFGEMPSEEKHGLPPHGRGLSHRARAFLKLAEACLAQALIATPTPFGVYVHWPFCLSKCPYCDFNSHVRHAAIDEPRFLRAFAGRDRRDRGARARPHRVEHLPRRRHAVADAARDRRRDPRRHRQALDRARPTSRSRSKPIRPASRRRAFAAIARPASTASRSACRRSTMPR